MNADRARILVVEDEPQIQRALRSGLTAQGYSVEAVSTGVDALLSATNLVPDMLILDLMLPGDVSGIDVCRRVREWTQTLPILILSAIGNERQKVQALDIGADDYLTKPFGMDELCARVRSLLRRGQMLQSREQNAAPSTFEFDRLSVDFDKRVVKAAGADVKLTPLEYEILKYLAQNADRVVTHRQLLSAVWGAEYVDDTQLLRVHVGHLRQKVEADPSRPKLIITEPGVGYRFRTS